MKTGEVMEAQAPGRVKGEQMDRRVRRRRQALAAVVLAGAVLAGCQGADPAREQYRLDGISQLDQGNYEAAITAFEEALNHSDGGVGEFELDVLKYRGEAEYKLGDYQAAAHTYNVLLQVDEAAAEYYYLECMSLAAMGETETAAQDFEKAQALEKEKGEASPVMGEAAAALGKAYQDAGQSEKAGQIYDLVIQSGKATAGIYNQLGLAAMDAGQWEEAYGYFSQGLSLAESGTEEYGNLLYNQAVCLERKGEFQEALEVFQKYTEIFGSDAEVEREIRFLETR